MARKMYSIVTDFPDVPILHRYALHLDKKNYIREVQATYQNYQNSHTSWW